MERIRANKDALSVMLITLAVVLAYSLWGAYILGNQKQAQAAATEVAAR